MQIRLEGRRPEAVRALETLQQQERAAAGEPALSEADFLRLLRQDVQGDFIRGRLSADGIGGVVSAIGLNEPLIEQRVSSLLKTWRLDEPGQWSRYEPPGIRWRIADFCGRVEASFARHGRCLSELPVVGTLTTGQVSATTQMTPSGSPLVLIENGFFKFAGALSQLGLFAGNDFVFRGSFSAATLQLVADLTATQTVLNTCLHMYPRATPAQYQSEVAGYVDAICLFVIGHEYGHIALGDLNPHPVTSQQGDRERRCKEFEADKVGFLTAVDVATDPAAGVFGAFFYFAGLDLIGRSSAVYEQRPAPTPEASSSEYPTPFQRTMNLLRWLESQEPHRSRFASEIKAASRCYNAILFAWDQILPAFRAARDQLAAFDPSRPGPSVPSEARTFGLVSTLWQYVLAHVRIS